MWVKTQRTRVDYLIFALLCMLIFLIGSTIVMKFVKSDGKNVVDEKTTDVETIEVFNYDKDVIENIDKFFLKILSNSNSSMSLFLKQKIKNKEDISFSIMENIPEIFNIDDYIKSQFPAAFTFLEKEKGISIKGFENKKRPEILEDIVFIDDMMEKEEGELLEEEKLTEKDKEGIPKAEGIKTFKANKNEPYIAIYHTHGTEAYLPIKQNQYHTQDKKYNVLTIGEIIEKKLESNGHKVLHIETFHDIPSYNKSYAKSLNTINAKMKEQQNLKVVFDVHRDGVSENASYKNKALSQSKIKIDGKDVATFSIVIGPESPNKDEVLKFAKYIKQVSDTMYPGLCKGIIIKPKGKFNQFVSDHYALIEVGSNLNTIDEAKESAKVIGEILSIVIENLQE
ncbi:stage II sporulation protein P [Anaerosalibacter bizertensis]|uniref:Stage II sporulation protein P n=1 Tax=Anaerosalibacter bizertensis TaxID=932217 RepID=A0A844FHZ9_9FIRM|nr:stage II sporulation protein P [Anaerosalibacter bizertensis]MSS43619.1 stage II sporulation protein P [Anaerosalibacter bizertensis]